MKPLIRKLKRYRKRNNATLDVIGAYLGFSGSYICHIEAERRRLIFKDALRLTQLPGSDITVEDVINYAKN